jgi:hypothetical protein
MTWWPPNDPSKSNIKMAWWPPCCPLQLNVKMTLWTLSVQTKKKPSGHQVIFHSQMSKQHDGC